MARRASIDQLQDSIHVVKGEHTTPTLEKRSTGLLRRITKTLPRFLQLQEQSEYTNVMRGTFDSLPPINSKVVRIFLSSTFSDMAAERNVLMERIYPKLKEYCKDHHGVEFQIIDMRWGVRDESQLDHQGPLLCYQEVFNCHAISVGPSFITILGQKYGGRPPLAKIPEDDFRLIKDTLLDLGENLDVLDEWYLCDMNNTPPNYILRPVLDSSSLEENPDLIYEAKQRWISVQKIILDQLQKAATKAKADGKMSKEKCRTFLSSVTETEISLGLLQASPKQRKLSAAFLRVIPDLTEHLGDSKVSKFIDMVDDGVRNAVNDSLREMMTYLREEIVPQCLSDYNVRRYTLPWRPEGVNPKDHGDYLDQFSNDFFDVGCKLIDRGVEEKSHFSKDDLYVEVLQHLHACLHHVRHFQGRQDIIQSIMKYLVSSTDQPLIVFGASGSGKTSLMAKCASQVGTMLRERGGSCVLLLRFLGTSPGTSNIRQSLKYLCRQMAVLINNEAETELAEHLDDWKTIVNTFYTFLEQLASPDRPVYVFLDSVDQLDSSDTAYHLHWVHTQLPPNVKMVYSTLPELHNLLTTFQGKLPEPSCYVEVKPLEEGLCHSILESLLEEDGRNLNPSQWDIVKDAFTQCSLPIFVYLVYHRVLSWRSFDTNEDMLHIEHTVRGSILQLFRNLERKYGKIFTSHALAYVTASRNGLSESELDDLLSLDDVVLRDVFQYHLPPLIRIPPLCWSRLRQDIGHYFVEREADATRVVFWYHRQFIEVAQEYFLGDAEFARKIHSNMADYFLGTWGSGRKKPFKYPQYLIKKLGLPPQSDEDRMVPPQPYVTEEKDTGEVYLRFNLRKLNELPLHLVQAGRFCEFYDYLAFDYEFLFNKLRATSRFNLLEDLCLPKKQSGEVAEELNLLINAIRISAQTLVFDPINLSVDLIGRLFEFQSEYPRIKMLLDQCRSVGREDCILLPKHEMFDSGSGVLHTSFDLEIGMGYVMPNGSIIAFNMLCNEVKFFDMDGSEFLTYSTNPYNMFLGLKYLTRKKMPETMVTNICAQKFKEQSEHVAEVMEKLEELEAAKNADDDEEEDGAAEKDAQPAENDTEVEKKDTANSEDNSEFAEGDSDAANNDDETTEDNDDETAEDNDDETAEDNAEDAEDASKVGRFTDVVRVDFKTGRTEILFTFGSDWLKKFKYDNIEYVGNHYVQYSERDTYSLTTLLSIDERKIVLEKIQGTIGTTDITRDERYFHYATKDLDPNEFFLMDLKSRDTWTKKLPADGSYGVAMTVMQDTILLVSHVNNEPLMLRRYKFPDENDETKELILETEKPITSDVVKKPRYAQSFLNASSTRWAVFIKYSSEQLICRGLIYSLETDDVLVLRNGPKVETTKKETSGFGDGTQALFIENHRLLVTSGTECLFLVWDLDTGLLLKKFKLGSAEGFLGGCNVDSTLLMISHFPDESVESADERMFIMAKIYNLEAMRKEIDSEDSEKQSKTCIFPPLCTAEFLPGESDLIRVNSKKNKQKTGQDLIFDTNICSSVKLENSEPFLNVDAKMDSDPLVYHVSDDRGNIRVNGLDDLKSSRIIAFNSYTVPLPENLLQSAFVDDEADLALSVKEASKKFQVTIVKLSTQEELSMASISFDVEDLTLFSPYDDEVIDKFKTDHPSRCQTVRPQQVVRRMAHEHQLVLVATEKEKFSEAMKNDLAVHILPGVVIVVDYSPVLEKEEFKVIHKKYFDVGTHLQFFSDGIHCLNYKLDVYNIETGALTRSISKEPESLILWNLVLTPDDRFAVGQHYVKPFQVEFALFDDDSDDDDMYNTQPPRTLQIYRLSDGKMVANYMFENEPSQLLLSEDGKTLIVCVFNEPIRVFSLDDGLQDVQRPATRQNRREIHTASKKRPAVTQGPKSGYLASTGIAPILTGALASVVEARPSDPIAFVAEYLRSHSSGSNTDKT